MCRVILGSSATVNIAVGSHSVKKFSQSLVRSPENSEKAEGHDHNESVDYWWLKIPSSISSTSRGSFSKDKARGDVSTLANHWQTGISSSHNLEDTDIKEGVAGPVREDQLYLDKVKNEQNHKPRYPMLCQFKSENIVSYVKGWRTQSGLLLAEPIVSNIHFTQDIAK